jgi:hypothetical protein
MVHPLCHLETRTKEEEGKEEAGAKEVRLCHSSSTRPEDGLVCFLKRSAQTDDTESGAKGPVFPKGWGAGATYEGIEILQRPCLVSLELRRGCR